MVASLKQLSIDLTNQTDEVGVFLFSKLCRIDLFLVVSRIRLSLDSGYSRAVMVGNVVNLGEGSIIPVEIVQGDKATLSLSKSSVQYVLILFIKIHNHGTPFIVDLSQSTLGDRRSLSRPPGTPSVDL